MKSQSPFKRLIILTILTILAWAIVIHQDIPQNTPEQAKNATESELKTDLLVMTGNTLIAVSSPVIERMKVLAVITAYNAGPGMEWQTDSTPCITASMLDVCKYPNKYNVIACPAWLKFGTKIRIEDKVFSCQDRMSAKRRYSKNPAYFDILKPTLQEAKEFGRQKKEVIIY